MNVETSPPPDPALPVALPLQVETAASAPNRYGRGWLRAAWSARGVTLGALALGMAGLGEALLLQPPTRLLSYGLLLGALALGAVAWWGLRERPLPTPAVATDSSRARHVPAWRLAGIA